MLPSATRLPRAAAPAPARSMAGASAEAPAPAAQKAVAAGDRFVSSGAPKEAAALQAAERVFYDRGQAGHEKGFRRTEQDPRDVNRLPEGAIAEARAQLKANAALEAERLARLTPADQARYQAVAAGIAKVPPARLALQALLFEGKLPGSLNARQETTLGALARVAEQPLAAGLTRDALLPALVQEVATPSAINQQDRGTCTVTSLSIVLAAREPAEYVRLVGELASPSGQATLANGETIQREPGTEKADGTKRSVSARLWQAALMEFGNEDYDYDNVTDVSTAPGKRPKTGGLDIIQVDKAIEGVFGTKTDYESVYFSKPEKRDALISRLGATLASGQAVLVGMAWGEKGPGNTFHGFHEVNLIAVEPDRVRFLNPWGSEDSMAMDEFKERLESANFIPAPNWR